ncbi:MAG: hypothetical protein WDZ59_14840 [Pirellulales bacterium]
MNYAWEVLGGDGQWVLIASGPVLELNPVDDLVQTLRLTVTDDDGASGSDQVQLTWQNTPP